MMITAIGLFHLDCFDKKKEQFGGGEVPVVGGERNHHQALTLLQVLKYNIPPS